MKLVIYEMNEIVIFEMKLLIWEVGEISVGRLFTGR
jgi:hypothetical protein